MLKTFIFPFLVSVLVATSPAFGDQNSDSTNFSRARFKIPKPRLYDGVYRTPPNVMTRLPAIMVQTSLNFTSQPALDRSGNLYSADLHKNLIEKCGPGGHTEIFSRDSRLKGPTAVVCDDKDNLYVANYFGGTILRFTPGGTCHEIASGLIKPNKLMLDKTEALYVGQEDEDSVLKLELKEDEPMAVPSTGHL